jgi:hypothetical protein
MASLLQATAAPFVPSSVLKVTAAPYIPVSHAWNTLAPMPFFAQRLDHFARWSLRVYGASLADLTDIQPRSGAGDIRKNQIFQASFRGRQIVYEADRLEDPRTGRFRVLV